MDIRRHHNITVETLERDLMTAVKCAFPLLDEKMCYSKATAIFFSWEPLCKSSGTERLKRIFETVYGYTVVTHIMPVTNSWLADIQVSHRIKSVFDTAHTEEGKPELVVIVYTGNMVYTGDMTSPWLWTNKSSGVSVNWSQILRFIEEPRQADVLWLLDCPVPTNAAEHAAMRRD
ncbi:hypothetical protein EDC01DRAFT_405508 [Geopyxis carbonaria]|nr:hypothetical protein EDC01DRAFT_405508 [Geopyxis carbonaria]